MIRTSGKALFNRQPALPCRLSLAVQVIRKEFANFCSLYTAQTYTVIVDY